MYLFVIGLTACIIIFSSLMVMLSGFYFGATVLVSHIPDPTARLIISLEIGFLMGGLFPYVAAFLHPRLANVLAGIIIRVFPRK